MFATMSFASLRLAALLLLPFLAACTISSDELLVSDADLAYPLPQTFALTPYMRDGEGGFVPDRKEPPRPFTLRDGAYWSDEGSLALRFVARPGGSFLLAASNPQEMEHLYGRAIIDGDVLVMQMMIDNDAELVSILAAADAAATPGTEGLSHINGGLVAETPQGLALAIGWLEDGTLEARPLVTYVGANVDAAAPEHIEPRDGGWSTR